MSCQRYDHLAGRVLFFCAVTGDGQTPEQAIENYFARDPKRHADPLTDRELAEARALTHPADVVQDLTGADPGASFRAACDEPGLNLRCNCRKASPGMWTSGYDATVRSFVRHGAEKCEEFVPRGT